MIRLNLRPAWRLFILALIADLCLVVVILIAPWPFYPLLIHATLIGLLMVHCLLFFRKIARTQGELLIQLPHVYREKTQWYMINAPFVLPHLITMTLRNQHTHQKEHLLLIPSMMSVQSWRTLHYLLLQFNQSS